MPNIVLRILSVFTKGMKETAGPLPPPQPSAAVTPATAAAKTVTSDQPGPPQFDVASVKRCDPDRLPAVLEGARGGGANSVLLTRGRLRALCLTPATLIRAAYGYTPLDLDFVPDAEKSVGFTFDRVYGLGQEDGRRVRGGPDWIKSERYTIEAVTGRGVSVDAHTMSGPMLRRLLEQRFQLKVHTEKEEAAAFSLTVAKGGLKMRRATPGSCDSLPGRPGAPIDHDGHPVETLSPPRSFVEVRLGVKPSCGTWTQRNGSNQVVIAGDAHIGRLIDLLTFELGGVRIFDHTGLTDRFDFILEYVSDENTPGLRRGRRRRSEDALAPSISDVQPAATIFSALQDQLGLKLEPARTDREYIVVDHIEHSTAN